MLEVKDLSVAYGDFQVLWGVSLTVEEREIVCLLGPNGAGKSTLLNTISGLVRPIAGSIEFLGNRIEGLPPHRIVERGLSHVLERRRLFPYLTVLQNLMLGSYNAQAKRYREESLEWVFDLFPILKERQAQLAHTLSGGEQQMLAIGRGLMSRPRFLMVDEPFLGLSPRIVNEIVRIIKKIHEAGVTVLFIEQNVQLALTIAHRGYMMESGHLILQGKSEELLKNEEVKRAFLGI